MPTLDQHQSQSAIKLLLIGDSGSGKSGALAPLVAAGYNLRIVDTDNGLDILFNILKDKCPDKLQNVHYETLTNKRKAVAGQVHPNGQPQAWSKAMNLLTKWEVGKAGEPSHYNLGSLETWTGNDVLVLDSLTMMSQDAMAHVLNINMRNGQQPYQSDWGDAMRMIEDMLGLLYSDAVKCNVIVISHITYIGDEASGLKGYPNTLGQKLPPKVGRYFNSMLQCVSKGTGTGVQKVIKTVSAPGLELKNPNPFKIPAEIKFSGTEGGLATYFELLRGKPTPAQAGSGAAASA